MTKRVLDYVISVAALLFLAIPMVIVGILIILTSVGAPIYRQPRVGLHGEIFTILKFRTMLNKEDGETKFTSPTDRRVTAVGRILRRWRIDEWPQFINVLKGEMSIVGPRPEQIGWVEIYNEEVPFFNLRHSVRPGITGWAQIHHGYTSTTDAATKKTEYDLYYIKYLSLSLDLTIMVQTLIVLFSGKGSR